MTAPCEISQGAALAATPPAFAAPWAATIDGQTYDLVEGTALGDTVADSNTVAGSLSRIPDGGDSNNAAVDWAFTTAVTKGAANVASS